MVVNVLNYVTVALVALGTLVYSISLYLNFKKNLKNSRKKKKGAV